jgi:pimeloyl-ACP methyl ester carboxylesterase
MRAFRVPGVGASLCYHDLAGDEPAIVFLHGLGGASSEAFPQTAHHRLLARSRAVLIDFLGFGYSEAPADFGYTMEEQADSVAALLDQLSLRGVNVVGHSMGGSVAISLAARHPRLLRSLVVAEGNLDPGKGTLSVRIAAQSEQEYIREGHSSLVREFGVRLGETPGYGGLLRTFAVAAPHAMHRSARSLLAERTPTFREALENLVIPRTYLIGERSLPDFPEGPAPKNGVTVAVVPGAGHLMNVDNPDGFAHAIAEVVAATEVGAEVPV